MKMQILFVAALFFISCNTDEISKPSLRSDLIENYYTKPDTKITVWGNLNNNEINEVWSGKIDQILSTNVSTEIKSELIGFKEVLNPQLITKIRANDAMALKVYNEWQKKFLSLMTVDHFYAMFSMLEDYNPDLNKMHAKIKADIRSVRTTVGLRALIPYDKTTFVDKKCDCKWGTTCNLFDGECVEKDGTGCNVAFGCGFLWLGTCDH
jgi:hypothetical protein